MEHHRGPDYAPAGHDARKVTGIEPWPRMFALVRSRDVGPSLDPYEVLACGLTYAETAVVSRCDPEIGLDTPWSFPTPEHARALLSHRFGELTTIWL